MHPWLPYNEFSRRLKWWLGRLIDRMEALERAFKLLKAKVHKLEDRLDEAVDEINNYIEQVVNEINQTINDLETSITEKIENILQTIETIQTAITTINNWITEAEQTKIPEIHLSTSSRYAGYVTLGEELVIEWGRINTRVNQDNFIDLTFPDCTVMCGLLTDTGSQENSAYSGGIFFVGGNYGSEEGHFLISRGINKFGQNGDDGDYDPDDATDIITYSWLVFARRSTSTTSTRGGHLSYTLLKGVA